MVSGPTRLRGRIERAVKTWRFAPVPAPSCGEISERLRHRSRSRR
jgi:hypothetical protein